MNVDGKTEISDPGWALAQNRLPVGSDLAREGPNLGSQRALGVS